MYETERLLLRPPRAQDAAAVFRGIANEEIVRNLASAPWPYAMEDAQAFAARPFNPDEPVLFLCLREGGELVGVAGLDRMPDGGTELGYWIARPHWNRGYAAEAGREMLRIAREELGLSRVVAGHFTDNPASGRVLEKLGFVATGAPVERHSRARAGTASCQMYEVELQPDAVAREQG